MIRRVIVIVVLISLVGGLVAYSKFQPQPNRVSGFVEADQIRLGSRVGGRVQKVYVEEGESVTQGQPLVDLEPFDLVQRENEAVEMLAAREADYQRFVAGLRPEEVAQAEAGYRQRKARYDLLVAGPRQQEIDAAGGRLRVAKAAEDLANRNYERVAKLYESKATPREAFDEASKQLEEAAATAVVRKKELELLEAGSREEEIREAKALLDEAEQAWKLAQEGYRSEEIQQAKAARDAAKAALEVIRAQKEELTIVAPVDGTIEALDLQQGDLAPTGAPVLSIMDEKRLWVRAYVPQNRLGLKVGQQLWVTAESLGDERLRGEIVFVSREAEFTPSNVQTIEERSKQVFRIKVALPSDQQSLRPGMTVDVWLTPIQESP